ncbi:hypothetical protein AVEN_101858-1 [Araneus ventricosus]|uniref:Helitron helicase-like domain-containing protein n=1 Tax=Araneus ventricosus TaxID=182803 RepID=A0A4Y2DAS2_ARAVE|nr:hypothetical protein AVEN_101858-1 [Araneus ventricosus]
MVFFNNDGEPPFGRDIRVNPVNPENPHMLFININILIPSLDPMTYPLLMVKLDGNQIGVVKLTREHSQIAEETRQQHLRTELYKGLADHLQNADANTGVKGGIPDILPLSFEGPPKNMRERCADAMSIFAKYGPPDIFIIFTSNSK